MEILRKILLAAAILAMTPVVLAQNITVSGTVTDNTGEPLIGATVMEVGAKGAAVTDIDGVYHIQVPADASLTFSYVGYLAQTIEVQGRTTINVELQENSIMLNEVVAIGYGSVKKSDATGSVAVIKPDDIDAGLATSFQDMLVGQTPGLVVTTAGGPEGNATMRIRGGSSLSASNDPLIVVDGVPLSNDGVQGMSNQFAMISPENVETITVLKDASATAIYGSRASNGVIIITTKKGQSGKPKVSFSANFYIDKIARYNDVLSAAEYRNLLAGYFGPESAAVTTLHNGETDWQKEVTRTTFSSDYNLAVGGSAGWLPYRVTLSYTNNNGILIDTKMDRLIFGFNLNPKFFDNHLTVNANAKGYYIRNQFANNSIGAALSFDPTAPIYTDYPITGGDSGQTTLFNGYYGIVKSNGLLEQNASKNPVANVKDNWDVAKVLRSSGNLQLDYSFHFLPELHANLNLGYDVSKTDEDYETYQNSQTAWLSHKKNGAGYKNYKYQFTSNTLLDFYLNYNKEFEQAYSRLDATVGYSWQRFSRHGWNYGSNSESGRPCTMGYINPTVTDNGYILNFDTETEDMIGKNYVNDDLDPQGNYHWRNHLQLISFFGRVNYSLLDRYLVTATLRADATSRFSPDNRWGYFPSVALGWKISEESFLEKARGWMNEWKLRLGWGQTGQQDVGSTNNYMPMYSIASPGGYYPFGNNFLPPYYLKGYNENLKWETTTTWNAGFDFGFLNNRITAAIDYYYRKTTDLQSYVTVPAGSSTTNQLYKNIGSLVNYGLEFNISAKPVVTRDFTWNLSYNIGWNHNRITSLYDDNAILKTGGISGGTGNTVQAHCVGYPANTFYLFEQAYGEDGLPLEGVYVDQNGDGSIDDNDLVLKHSKDPKVTMTFSSQFRYKKWDLGFNLRASFGNYVYNNVMSNNNNLGETYSAYGHYNVIRNEIYFTSTQYFSDYWLRNGSFLRCDNITLGYTWDDLLNGDLNIRLFGAVQNPFIITRYNGIDPERFSGIDNNSYPRATTFSLGVVVNF